MTVTVVDEAGRLVLVAKGGFWSTVPRILQGQILTPARPRSPGSRGAVGNSAVSFGISRHVTSAQPIAPCIDRRQDRADGDDDQSHQVRRQDACEPSAEEAADRRR